MILIILPLVLKKKTKKDSHYKIKRRKSLKKRKRKKKVLDWRTTFVGYFFCVVCELDTSMKFGFRSMLA